MTSQLTVNDAINALDKKGKKGGKKAAKKSGKSNVNESVSSGTEETIVPKDSLEGILEVGIKKIEKSLTNGEPIDEADFRIVVFLALFGPSERNVLDLSQKVCSIENDIKETKKEVLYHDIYFKEVDKRLVSLEVENHSNKFLLKNVPLKVAGDKENFSDTEKTVEDLLHLANLDLTSVDEFFRLYPKTEKKNDTNNDTKPPNIFMKFSCKRQLYQFIGKLGEIKKHRKFQNIQLEKMVPSRLMEIWNRANLKAFELRKEKKMKTKTEIRYDEVLLFAKKGDQSWTQIDF